MSQPPPEPNYGPVPQYGQQSTGAPPPPGQPYAPAPPPPGQQSYAAAPPPRKRRKWPIVLLILAILLVLGIGGCIAIVGSVSQGVSESLEESEQRSEPREVVEGEAFTIGKHETLAGWKVKKDDALGEPAFNVVGKVKNISDETSTSFIHFKFLSSSGEVLGNVDCNSGDLEPGQTQNLNCILDGTYGKYAKITAEATF